MRSNTEMMKKDNYGISITKTTIINGNGHTIDANGHGSIFCSKRFFCYINIK